MDILNKATIEQAVKSAKMVWEQTSGAADNLRNFYSALFDRLCSETITSTANYQKVDAEMKDPYIVYTNLDGVKLITPPQHGDIFKRHQGEPDLAGSSIFNGGLLANNDLIYKVYVDVPNRAIVFLSYSNGMKTGNYTSGRYIDGTEITEKFDLGNMFVFYDCDDKNSVAFKDKLAAFSVVQSSLVYPRQSQINFLCQERNFYLRETKLANMDPIDLDTNYGEGFAAIDDQIMKFLASDRTGLILLHGNPGTGKTYYIRNLIRKINEKVIYVPSDLVHSLSSPAFIPFLMENTDAVLVIEDAEQVVATRDGSDRSVAVANLLNLTDGILGDMLKMKIICTFNIDIGGVDKALLRKGRLELKHEFGKLSVSESNRLLTKLNSDYKATEPMSLADVYNVGKDNNGIVIEKAIGFAV